MEKEEIIIENPVTVAGITLVPVTGVSLNHWCGKRGVLYFSVKEPLGVVVVSPSAKRAFRITGEEVLLDQLIIEAPGLKEVLEGI
jgi:hypothetical protein